MMTINERSEVLYLIEMRDDALLKLERADEYLKLKTRALNSYLEKITMREDSNVR